MSSNPTKVWLLGIAMVIAVAIMGATVMNTDFNNRVMGVRPYSELRVVGASGKLGSIELPTAQQKGMRRLKELEVTADSGVRFRCDSWGREGILCKPQQPVKK